MRALKNIFAVSAVLALSVGLVACGGSKKKTSQGLRRAGDQRYNDGTVGDAGNSFEVFGKIISSNNQGQSAFQTAVEEFISSVVDLKSSELGFGTVSGADGQDTGVRFGGQFRLSNDESFSSNRSDYQRQNLKLVSNKLEIQIRDSIAAANKDIGVLNITFGLNDLVLAELNRNRVSLVFKNEYLAVDFEGEFKDFAGSNAQQESFLSGTVFYKNVKEGRQGELGQFFIRTCEIIECQ